MTCSKEHGSIVRLGQQQKYLQLDDNSFIAFYAPLKNNNNTYLTNLRIYVKDLPLTEIGNLSTTTTTNDSSLLDKYTFEFVRTLKVSNFTIVEPITKTFLNSGNNGAYKIQYLTEDRKQSILEIWTLKTKFMV